jgi:hypothetical protein
VSALEFWAFWGSIEAFYEGWYFPSLWMNLKLTAIQYLAPVLLLLAAGIAAVLLPRLGAVLHWLLALGVISGLGFGTRAGLLLIALPLSILGVLYWFGRVRPRKLAVGAICILPAVTIMICGAVPACRVIRRVDDGYRGSRVIEGNGVRLRWAPAGPGWPERGGDWYQAQNACSSLSRDGTQTANLPQGIWRLPTSDELVRSMVLHGRNVRGSWNASPGVPYYKWTPDKESPLWNAYSPVIYWWTATELGEQAYRFSYNGRALPTLKKARADYYGFRCVTEP